VQADSGRIGKRTLAIAGASDGARTAARPRLFLLCLAGAQVCPAGTRDCLQGFSASFMAVWKSSNGTGIWWRLSRWIWNGGGVDCRSGRIGVSAVRGAESTGGGGAIVSYGGARPPCRFRFLRYHTLPVSARAPQRNSAASRAAAETRGQVLTYEGRAIAALYSADCGGHTRTLADAGLAEWRIRRVRRVSLFRGGMPGARGR